MIFPTCVFATAPQNYAIVLKATLTKTVVAGIVKVAAARQNDIVS